jgi:23S rRNA pseudouridine2605 synthase
VYYLLNKPRAMVTTLKDPEDRPTIAELLTGIKERVYPVGRLDFHTSGALLVTNDGALADALLHPKHGVKKTYVAKLDRPADMKQLRDLREGVTLDDGHRTQPSSVVVLREEEGHAWLEITISEGKNRQIHRMAEAVGLRVMRLSRIRFAGLDTQGLRPGELRPLHPEEVDVLRHTYLGIVPARAVREPERRPKAKSPAEKSKTPPATKRASSARPRDSEARAFHPDQPNSRKTKPAERVLEPAERLGRTDARRARDTTSRESYAHAESRKPAEKRSATKRTKTQRKQLPRR